MEFGSSYPVQLSGQIIDSSNINQSKPTLSSSEKKVEEIAGQKGLKGWKKTFSLGHKSNLKEKKLEVKESSKDKSSSTILSKMNSFIKQRTSNPPSPIISKKSQSDVPRITLDSQVGEEAPLPSYTLDKVKEFFDNHLETINDPSLFLRLDNSASKALRIYILSTYPDWLNGIYKNNNVKEAVISIFNKASSEYEKTKEFEKDKTKTPLLKLPLDRKGYVLSYPEVPRDQYGKEILQEVIQIMEDSLSKNQVPDLKACAKYMKEKLQEKFATTFTFDVEMDVLIALFLRVFIPEFVKIAEKDGDRTANEKELRAKFFHFMLYYFKSKNQEIQATQQELLGPLKKALFS